jgi:hypothetical protein
MNMFDFNSQFSRNYEHYIEGLGVDNWYRFFFVIKEVIKLKPRNILEIGAGNKIVRNCLSEFVPDYKVIDINPNLNPDFVCDLRDFQSLLEGKFDCVICTDVLEHIPFRDLGESLDNIYKYLGKSGKAIITIPHQRHYFFLIMFNKAYTFTLPIGITPGLFYSRFIKKDVWIDPDHCWEIGTGEIKKKDVEKKIEKAGFRIDKFMKALYVDFWVLDKKR